MKLFKDWNTAYKWGAIGIQSLTEKHTSKRTPLTSGNQTDLGHLRVVMLWSNQLHVWRTMLSDKCMIMKATWTRKLNSAKISVWIAKTNDTFPTSLLHSHIPDKQFPFRASALRVNLVRYLVRSLHPTLLLCIKSIEDS